MQLCFAAKCCCQCPLWVISGHMQLQQAMSALHPIADMCSALGDVRFVPIADIRSHIGNFMFDVYSS